MAGFIAQESVEEVRQRAQIDQIVGAQVALSPAGMGRLKGLCPFHDEKTASFTVRPAVGRYHCFGCGEGGDAISFVQKTAGLGFTEAVEHLAAQVGVTVRYEQGGGRTTSGAGQSLRQRALAANQAAQQFYAAQLLTPAAAPGRELLKARAFDRQAAEQFGVGFAPPTWDSLARHLQGKGFTTEELLAAGLVAQGSSGVYDRFRGRLTWPIRDTTGAVIGFGARELAEYVNPVKLVGQNT